MWRIVLSLTLLALLCCPLNIARGQDKEDKPSLAGAGGAAGIGQYPPLNWGVVASTIVNPTDSEQKLLVTFNFDDTSTLQFASQVWVPPQSRRTVWLPIRTNSFEVDPFKPRTLALTQQLFDMNGAQPVMLSQQPGLLIATRDHWITGMLSGGSEADDEAEDDSINAALAMRQSMDLSRRMARQVAALQDFNLRLHIKRVEDVGRFDFHNARAGHDALGLFANFDFRRSAINRSRQPCRRRYDSHHHQQRRQNRPLITLDDAPVFAQ